MGCNFSPGLSRRHSRLRRKGRIPMEGSNLMNERLTLPVLPLREVVLFPGVAAPIGAARPGTLKTIEAALTTPEKLVFAVSQRENVENVNADVLYTIGTVARIGQMQRGLAGVQLLLQGEHRG